jgi:uncharacterized membrane protein
MENTNAPSNEIEKKESDPSNWKWGIFYYNKNDKRLFPPKRIKQLGWTINFANPLSIVAMLVVIVLLVIIVQLFTKI